MAAWRGQKNEGWWYDELVLFITVRPIDITMLCVCAWGGVGGGEEEEGVGTNMTGLEELGTLAS